MFTGLVKSIGRIDRLDSRPDSLRLRICFDPEAFQEIELGESISVNGVCLTALDPQKDSFEVDVSSESLEKTNLGQLEVHSLCNLERALRLGDRLGGHMVQGHVDGMAQIVSIVTKEGFCEVRLQIEAQWKNLIIQKGSITVDGVSLTINEIIESPTGLFVELMIIPHTWSHTIFKTYTRGSRVNIEFDQTAKYIQENLKQMNLNTLIDSDQKEAHVQSLK